MPSKLAFSAYLNPQESRDWEIHTVILNVKTQQHATIYTSAGADPRGGRLHPHPPFQPPPTPLKVDTSITSRVDQIKGLTHSLNVRRNYFHWERTHPDPLTQSASTTSGSHPSSFFFKSCIHPCPVKYTSHSNKN